MAAASIAVGAVVLGLKGSAWAVTGSAALFSDAAETVVNVAAAAMALVALLYAARPPDANHPYGHDKAEFFSAIVEGGLIIVASLVILQHAWNAFRAPSLHGAPWTGLVLNGVATVLNFGWSSLLLRQGKLLRSPALAADARHLAADVAASLGVLAGLVLAFTTGLLWLDPLLAALVAVYVLVSGLLVIGNSVGGLMDAAPAPDIVARIRDLVSTHAEGAIEAHDLRTRHAGRLTYLEFHLVVPGDMTVATAHGICDRVETALRAEMEGLVITIHVEPEAKAKHHGVLVV
jgi:cation diffusion facilitator family transporter